ncbi:MAG: hypothetical protein ABIF19_20480, partial [Planctomycetota bacterium]
MKKTKADKIDSTILAHLLRRQLYREATQMQRAVLKGSRWLLLKAPENLKGHRDPGKDERIRLQ